MTNDFNAIAEEDLRTGEAIGIAVALVVLVLVFGTVASGVIPIILAVVAIAIAMGLAALVGQFFDLSFFITNMITMIGLAVGIDYSLFIVSRYREERGHGMEKLDAIERAGATATRAVFFSGLTVVLALIGMLILPNTLFRALGTGAILVVIVAVAASLTLLPAVLSLMGDRIDALKVRRRRSPDETGRFWERWTRIVMGRPVISLVFSAGLLILAASSMFSMNSGLSGVSTLPDDMESKVAFEILATEFAGGLTSPLDVVVTGEGVDATLIALQDDIAADGGFGEAAVDPASTGTLAILSVQLLGDVNSIASQEAVRHLRADIIPGSTDGANLGLRRWRDRDHRRLPRSDRHLHPDRLRGGARAELHPAAAGVPIHSDPGKGDRDEPAVGRRRLRAGGCDVPRRCRPGVAQGHCRLLRIRAGGDDRGLAAAVPVLDPVRAVDGLPRVLAVSNQGALRPDQSETPIRLPTACEPPGH